MTSVRKPRVAVHKFSSCDGCQLALLNLGEDLLMLAERVELVHFAEAGPLDPDIDVDVAFVEGSVSTPEDLERIQHIRRHSRFLIPIGACATANMRADFMGAAFLNRIARFMIDPRDERPMANYFDVVGTDEGVFGCIGLMACDDLCPMEIPLQGQLAFVRRKMAQMALKCARCK